MALDTNELDAPSMKVPPKRKGNPGRVIVAFDRAQPSMKVPPKRKGNTGDVVDDALVVVALNESPSEKEGKCWKRLRPPV